MLEAMASLSLPPGFGFHPTDVEVIDYLKRKILGLREKLEIIPELDIYKHEPWELPGKSLIPSRHCKWHFLTARDRKYPNGARRNRATKAGYWKATGKDRDIRRGQCIIGTKKTLVFHKGRAPSKDRTDWIMHEYHIDSNECAAAPGMHDAFVLCRIMKKNGLTSQDEETIEAHTENSDFSLKDQTSLAATPINYQNHSIGMVVALDNTPTTSEIRDEGLQKMPTSPSMISDGLTCDGLQPSAVSGSNSDIIPPLNEPTIESLTGHADSLSPKPNPEDSHASLSVQDFPDLDFLRLPNYLWPSEFNRCDVLENPESHYIHNNQKNDMLHEEQNLLEEIYCRATEASWRSKVDAHSPPSDFTDQENLQENVRASDSINWNKFGLVDINNEGKMKTSEPTDSGNLFDSSDTGIRRRSRSKKPQKGECSNHRIRLQIYKMQSNTHGLVENCTFDQNVVSLPESNEYSDQFCGDKEKAQGFFRSVLTFFQHCSSMGSSYLLSAGCILGPASLVFYFPLRAACRSLKVFSWMSSLQR